MAKTQLLTPTDDQLALRNRAQFVECLEEVQTWLRAEGIEYRIIGSIAVAAYTGSDPNFNRPHAYAAHQRIPDIDLVTPRSRVADMRRYHTEMLRRPFPVFLGIIPAFSEIEFRPEDEYSYLRHKELAVPIKTSVFAAQQVKFDSAEITTVNPVTLRGLYGNGAWLGKQKDKDTRASLTRVITETGYAYDESDYAPFDEYVEGRKAYPMFIYGKLAAERLLSALPPIVTSFIRHYGAQGFIERNWISMLAYKPM